MYRSLGACILVACGAGGEVPTPSAQDAPVVAGPASSDVGDGFASHGGTLLRLEPYEIELLRAESMVYAYLASDGAPASETVALSLGERSMVWNAGTARFELELDPAEAPPTVLHLEHEGVSARSPIPAELLAAASPETLETPLRRAPASSRRSRAARGRAASTPPSEAGQTSPSSPPAQPTSRPDDAPPAPAVARGERPTEASSRPSAVPTESTGDIEAPSVERSLRARGRRAVSGRGIGRGLERDPETGPRGRSRSRVRPEQVDSVAR